MHFTPLSKKSVLSSLLCSIVLVSACGFNAQGDPRFCEENQEACALAGFVLIGGILASGSGDSDGSGNGGGGNDNVGNASDPSLKTDVLYLQTLDNGIRLYAFRYIGQEQGFVGVMADELQNDPRYAHAVQMGADGYLRVDYSQLPVELFNMEAMDAASEQVLNLMNG